MGAVEPAAAGPAAAAPRLLLPCRTKAREVKRRPRLHKPRRPQHPGRGRRRQRLATQTEDGRPQAGRQQQQQQRRPQRPWVRGKVGRLHRRQPLERVRGQRAAQGSGPCGPRITPTWSSTTRRRQQQRRRRCGGEVEDWINAPCAPPAAKSCSKRCFISLYRGIRDNSAQKCELMPQRWHADKGMSVLTHTRQAHFSLQANADVRAGATVAVSLSSATSRAC